MMDLQRPGVMGLGPPSLRILNPLNNTTWVPHGTPPLVVAKLLIHSMGTAKSNISSTKDGGETCS